MHATREQFALHPVLRTGGGSITNKPAFVSVLGAVAVTLLAGSVRAQTDLSLWYHGAGNAEERKILTGIIEDFNASQKEWRVSLQEFPQAAYNESVIATAAILKSLVTYSQQYLWPLLVTQSETYRPVMAGLQYFFQLQTPWGEVMAYLTLISVPVLVFYLLLQRFFIASIASTGIKG